MKTSTTIWLLMAVLAVAGLILFVDRVNQTQSGRVISRGLILADLRADSVHYVMIEMGALHVDCVRKDDKWFVKRPLTARADQAKIGNILSIIETIRAREVITAEQRTRRDLSLEDYGLAKPRARFAIFDGNRRRELAIGCDSPLGDRVYVKLDNSENIIATETNILSAIPPSVEFLRDRTVLHGESARTMKMEIQRPGLGFIQLVRQADRWHIQQPIRAYADTAKVGEMLDLLYGVKVEKFVWDRTEDLPDVEAKAGTEVRAGGLNPDEATAHITVWVGDDQVGRELLLGKPVPDSPDMIYARPRSIDSTYVIRKRVLEAFSVGVNELRDRKIFPMAPSEVRYVSLQKGDRKVVLEWKKDLGWFAVEPVQWKADDQAVNDLVRRLAGFQVMEFADGSVTNLATLGLDPPSCIIQILAARPEPAANLIPPTGGTAEVAKGPERPPPPHRLLVGACPPQARKTYVHFEDEPVRFGDGASVYAVPPAMLQELGSDLTDPLTYRDRTMLAVVPENVARISLTKRGVQQVVEKDKAGEWVDPKTPDKKARREVVDDIMFFVSNMRAFQVESHSPKDLVPYGLDQPQAVLTLGLTGGESIQKSILMGAGAGAEGIYAMIQGQDVVFVMENGVAERLTRDLLDNTTGEGTARHPSR